MELGKLRKVKVGGKHLNKKPWKSGETPSIFHEHMEFPSIFHKHMKFSPFLLMLGAFFASFLTEAILVAVVDFLKRAILGRWELQHCE